jgi:hypothetical protein
MSTYPTGANVTSALKQPNPNSGPQIKDLVQQAGWQVEGIDWAFQKVTGESIVEKVIEPITGDFDKISHDGDAWRSIGSAMTAFAQEFHTGVSQVRQNWVGGAATQYEAFVQGGWMVGLYAEGKVCQLIAKGFDTVSDVSQKLCLKALNLLKTLVDKIIEAIGEIWVPVAGWAAAATKIWDAYQLFQQIVQIIEMVKDLIKQVSAMWDSLKDIGSQLEKIHSPSDVIPAMENIAGDVQKAGSDTTAISADAKGITANAANVKEHGKEAVTNLGPKSLAKDLKSGAHQFHDNVPAMGSRAHQVGQNAVEGLKNAPSTAWEHTKSAANNAMNSVQDGSAWESAKSHVSGAVQNAAHNAYQNNVGKYVDAAKAAPGQVHDAVSGGIDAAKQAPGHIAGGWDAVKNASPGSVVSHTGDLLQNTEAGKNFHEAYDNLGKLKGNSGDSDS